MSEGHLTLAEIAAVANRAEDDPRRAHLESCVQCRSLARRYGQFVSPPSHVPVADLRKAEDSLAAFLAREVAPAGMPDRPATQRGTVLPLQAWARWGAPALAIAAAALVVSAAMVVVQRNRGVEDPSGALRGQAGDGHASSPLLLPPVNGTNGAVELSWRRVSTADRYELRLYSPELRELAALPAAPETAFVLTPGAVAGVATGDTLLWQVGALRGDYLLAKSGLQIVVMP